MDRADIAVVGTGPAGISAAITAKLRNKTVLLIGSKNLSPKIEKAHTIKNYPGIPEASGEMLANAFKGHLSQMDIDITEDKVTAVYAMGDYFALQGSSGEMYNASAVILATGVVNSSSIEGEDAMLGNGVSYCATCDAPLYKGREVAVIAYSKKEEEEANYLAEVCSKVLYFPLYKEDVEVADGIEVIRQVPKELAAKDMRTKLIKTEEGEYEAAGIFVLRENVAPSKLVPGLETEGGHVKVNRQCETNLKGLYACGDVTGTPYQYIKAAGEGNVAALSAVRYLSKGSTD